MDPDDITLDTSSNCSSTIASSISSATSNLSNNINSISTGNLLINGGGSLYTTTPSYTYTYGSGISYNDFTDFSGYNAGKAFKLIINTSTEDQLKEIVNRVLEKTESTEDKELFITMLFKNRHFSEEFLLEYIDYISEDDRKEAVYFMHEADVVSGVYSKLALLFIVK